jgi:hypothetical protein
MLQLTEMAYIKLTRWWIFSVLFALMPFLFKILIILSLEEHLSKVNSFINFMMFLFGQGDLLLISTALCAVAIGEVFGVTTDSITKNVASGGSLILIAVASFYYAIISVMGEKLSDNAIILTSIGIFILSVISSSFCILITAEDKKE